LKLCGQPKKLAFKGKVSTTLFMEPIHLFLMISEVLRRCGCQSGSEEKETSVLTLAHTLALFQYPERTEVATFED
jgi:hypothetical protein